MTLLEFVTERLMETHGYNRNDKSTLIEWDPNYPESQYSFLRELAEAAVRAVEDALDIFEENNSTSSSPPRPSAVVRRVATYLSIGELPGTQLTVGDVREWLSEVEGLGIPDDSPVNGSISVGYEETVEGISSISCGECFSEEDILISLHTCAREHPSVVSKNTERKEKSDFDPKRLKRDLLDRKYRYLVESGDDVAAQYYKGLLDDNS